MAITVKRPPLPSDDKRWRILDATMRRHGYSGNALIESLHTAQESFGFLDEKTMQFIGGSLNVPLSRVFGVDNALADILFDPGRQRSHQVCIGEIVRNDFQQIHVARWVEKVRAKKAALVFFRKLFNDLLQQNTRCIGSDGNTGTMVFLNAMVDAFLYVKLLDHHFDNPVGVSHYRHVIFKVAGNDQVIIGIDKMRLCLELF